MTQYIKVVVAAVVVAGSFVAFMFAQSALASLEEEARSLALASENVAAWADTTREVLAERNDSIRVWQRRAVQAEIERDALAEELGMSQRAVARLTLALDRVEARDTATVVEAEPDVRNARFEAYVEPVKITADVTMPPIGQSASASFVLDFDPIPLAAHVGCLPPALRNTQGVQAATLVLETPEWLVADMQEVTYDLEVCSPRQPDTSTLADSWMMGAGAVGTAWAAFEGEHEVALGFAGLTVILVLWEEYISGWRPSLWPGR